MNWLRNLTLRTRLLLGFALILALFAGYCFYSLAAMQRLGALTEEIYDHPLQVSNAALRAGSGVSKMHLSILAIANSTSQVERLQALQAMREEATAVTANLDLIRRQILGAEGMQLLRETQTLYDAWGPLRQEIIGLAEGGERQAATEAMLNRGAPHVARLEAQMQQLNAYARNKADGFMQSAREEQQRVLRDTIGGFIGVTLAAALIAFLVLRSILAAIGDLKGTMAAITSSGTLAKAELAGRDELTEMGGHFNRLVDRLQERFWLRDGVHALGRRLADGSSLQELTEQGLATVARQLDACAGALYLCAGEDGDCRREATYALAEGELFAPRFAFGEGIVGQVARERQPMVLTDIDAAAATVVSGTLRQPPRSICVLPLLHEEQLVGVLELAGFTPWSALQREYLDAAGGIIATALAVARQNARIRQLLEETRAAHQKLEEKTGALDRSNEELTAANTEMRSQSEELKAQTEELRGQTAELLRQRALVEEADRLKSEFLSNMSHELRTPLNSIMALSQLMISRGVGGQPEQEIQYLQVIERNGRHLLSLINDILDLAKIESGRMDLYLTDFDPAQPVKRALETVAPLAREKGLPLRFEHTALPPLRADEDKVHQILLNLLSNAVKFTDAGEVEVRLTAEAEQLRFTVRDTGIGIDAEHQQQIFDEFRQVDGSTTRRHEGTGLGLAICQKLAQLLGGHIELQSTPGEGSTFSLLLPLHAGAESAPLPAAPAAAPLPRAGDGPSILVIDDEAGVRELLQRHLSQAGYRVALAAGGRQGLELARQLQPAAITLDVMMPELDGWEVIRQLKADPATASIPVLVVSLSDDRATGVALGAAGFVIKPVDRNLLLAEIARIAARRPVRRVLVVDDDPWSRTRVEAVLAEKSIEVEAAGGGEEGLAKALAEPPDALILDLMMPGMDGFTVLERLRQTSATHDLPVIILTAKDLSAGERSRLQQSVHRVITKGGMDRGELLREIEAALAAIGGMTPPGAAPMPTVLVVEDNPVAVLQIRSALEERGYAVDVADGGAEALACVAARIPDAIVLDLMMPEIDGFQVLEEIRSTPRTATLPVLVLTAKELTAADRSRLSHNNISQLVQKGSLDRDQLVACVDRLFRPAASSPAVPPAAAQPTSAGPILVVEDNPDNRFTLGAILDQAGFPHVAVTDGEQAVQAAAQHRPRLILMDMQLPVLSGMEATARIKADPELQPIPIVALTAKAMKGDRETILAQGCDDYLAKPLEPAALLALLGKWLGPE